MSHTIEDIYAAINAMPAQLTAKGIIKPSVIVQIEANAKTSLHISWTKRYARPGEYDHEFKFINGETVDEILEKAATFIRDLPNADQAKLTHFMGALGKLIDGAKDDGIQVDYLNPLLDTMKRLSENVLTFAPQPAE